MNVYTTEKKIRSNITEIKKKEEIVIEYTKTIYKKFRLKDIDILYGNIKYFTFKKKEMTLRVFFFFYKSFILLFSFYYLLLLLIILNVFFPLFYFLEYIYMNNSPF